MFGRNPRYAWIAALFMAVVTLVLGLLQLRQVEHLQTRAVPMAAVVAGCGATAFLANRFLTT